MVPDLLLRPWAVTDAPALRDAIDEDVGHLRPWLTWTLDEPATLERTRERLRGYVNEFRSGRSFRYAIAPADRPAGILGGVHLNCRVGPAAHDLGYWVRRSAVRRGIATAAVCALTAHAFARRAIDRLVIQCDIANERSAAMARALGFEFAGERTLKWPDGSPRPAYEFELRRERYHRDLEAAFLDRAARVSIVETVDRDPTGTSPA